MPLSETGTRIVQVMKDRKVFKHTSEHGLHFTGANVMVVKFCGDGLKAHDKVAHQRKICAQIGIPPEHLHLLSTNGGALWMSAHPKFVAAFPRHFNEVYPKSEMDLDEVVESCDLMDTNIVGVYGHGPCAKARQAGMNVFEVVDSVVTARANVLAHGERMRSPDKPSLIVLPYYHIESGHKETFLLEPELFLEQRDELEYISYEIARAHAGSA